jgi:hypothetical protein
VDRDPIRYNAAKRGLSKPCLNSKRGNWQSEETVHQQN